MYSTFENINKSFKLAWKYKILWVFAFILAGIGASSSFNNTSSGNSKKSTVPSNSQNERTTTNSPNDVLGISSYLAQASQKLSPMPPVNDFTEATTPSNSLRPLSTAELLRNEYEPMYIAVIAFITTYWVQVCVILFEILLVSILGGILSAVMRSWTESGFIKGLQLGIEDKPLVLAELGTAGRVNAVSMFKFKLMLSLLSLTVVLIGVLSIVAVTLTGNAILVFLALIPILCVVLALTLYFAGIDIFGTRSLVQNNLSSGKAFSQGNTLLGKGFGKVVKLFLGNCLVQVVVLFAIFMVLGIVFFLISILAVASMGVLLLPLIPVILACIVAAQVAGAYIYTFKGFTWSNLFKHLTAEDVK